MKNKIKPEKRQESVWDYPRPPRLEKTNKPLQVIFAGKVIAETNQAFRILETSHPPVYYIPPSDVRMSHLFRHPERESFCEFKGKAVYWDIIVGDKKSLQAAWSYPSPNKNYLPIKDYLAFYPGRVDECYVNGEQVQSQEGDFYGGWITKDIVGPFKGGKGTWGW